VDIFVDHAVSCKTSDFGDRQIGLNLFSAMSLPKPEFRMTAKWMSPGMADALQISC